MATAALYRRDSSWRMPVALATLSWTAVLLSLVEVRGTYIGSAFVPIVGGWAVHRALTEFAGPGSVKTGATALLATSLFLFGVPWVVGVNMARAFGFLPSSEFVKTGECIDALERLKALPKGTILSPLDLDIPILFHTSHSVIATSYHRGVAGIVAGIESFSGSEEDMRRHVLNERADYVVVCAPWLTGDPAYAASFARALAEGKSVSWLELVGLDSGPLLAWRVVR